jgi:predicted glycosyltransferase
MNEITNRNRSAPHRSLKIWLDLANSPHPVLFEPIVAELLSRRHEVVLTARDHAQTVALAQQRWPNVEVIGANSPRGRAGKAGTIVSRGLSLARFARTRCFDVAASHNSYAQAVAARFVGIPCLTAMDYEHQPANHVAFRAAQRILVPEDFPHRELRLQGGHRGKVWRYEGFKEEVYLSGFSPDPTVLEELRLLPEEPFLVARPSPDGATYHQFDNPLFVRVVRRLLDRHGVKVVLLPRRPEDRFPYAKSDRYTVIPDAPVDTRSLLYYATALIGAGGTMNREAALLGTPVFSLYAGKLGALDRRLIHEGRLRFLTNIDELLTQLLVLSPSSRPRERPVLNRRVLDRFIEAIETPFHLTAGDRRWRRNR